MSITADIQRALDTPLLRALRRERDVLNGRIFRLEAVRRELRDIFNSEVIPPGLLSVMETIDDVLRHLPDTSLGGAIGLRDAAAALTLCAGLSESASCTLRIWNVVRALHAVVD